MDCHIRKILYILISSSLLIGCVAPRAFDSQTQEENWWLCRPLDDKSWDCGDNGIAKDEPVPSILPPEPSSSEDNTAVENISDMPLVEKEVEKIEGKATEESYSPQGSNNPESQKNSAELEPVVADIASIESATAKPGPPKPVLNEAIPSIISDTGDWMIQIGSFKTRSAAVKFSDTVAQSKVMQKSVNGQIWHRVYLGFFKSKQEASESAQRLESERSINTWVRSRHQ